MISSHPQIVGFRRQGGPNCFFVFRFFDFAFYIKISFNKTYIKKQYDNKYNDYSYNSVYFSNKKKNIMRKKSKFYLFIKKI